MARFRSLTFESRQAYVKVVDRGKQSTTASAAAAVAAATTTSTSRLSSFGDRPPPKFYLSPEDRNAQVDDEVIFECLAFNDASTQVLSQQDAAAANASDLQYYRYKWLKDGIAVDLR